MNNPSKRAITSMEVAQMVVSILSCGEGKMPPQMQEYRFQDWGM